MNRFLQTASFIRIHDLFFRLEQLIGDDPPDVSCRCVDDDFHTLYLLFLAVHRIGVTSEALLLAHLRQVIFSIHLAFPIVSLRSEVIYDRMS